MTDTTTMVRILTCVYFAWAGTFGVSNSASVVDFKMSAGGMEGTTEGFTSAADTNEREGLKVAVIEFESTATNKTKRLAAAVISNESKRLSTASTKNEMEGIKEIVIKDTSATTNATNVLEDYKSNDSAMLAADVMNIRGKTPQSSMRNNSGRVSIGSTADAIDKKERIATTILKKISDQMWTARINNKIEDLASSKSKSGPRKHPCRRPCGRDERPRTCTYEFSVEHFYTMSKACQNCYKNQSDCDRAHCVTADGIQRPIITVNRLLPGPAIEVCLNDHIVVDVSNNLGSEATTVHWHGLHQQDTPFMDGVPFVSQCPISPNSVFRYSFTANNPGTHFWHSHSGVQRGDGSFGGFIVRMPDQMNPHRHLYDEDLSEHTMLVLDWSHELGVSMLTAHYQVNGTNKPQSMIVNGRGRYFNNSQQLTSTPLEHFNVIKGKRYRFRLINAGVQNCPIDLTIDNHNLTIISTDGSDVKPLNVDSLVSYAGERWDFVLEANADIDNYLMRFTGLMDCAEKKAHQVAILHYEGSSSREPTENVGYNVHEKRSIQMNSMNVKFSEEGTLSVPHLEAIEITPDERRNILKANPDKKMYIEFDFHPKNNPHYHNHEKSYGFYDVNKTMQVYTPQLNDITMEFPHFPLMSQYEDIKNDSFCDHQKLAAKDCSKNFCQCINVEPITLGDVVEIILIDKGVPYDANHPFHLHGHPFRVVGMDRLANITSKDVIKQMDEENRLLRNLANPPLKDTVTVPDGGYTIIRVHFTNPGYWLFHCHIEYHAEVGMALIFKVGEHEDFKPVPKGFPRCGDYGLHEKSDEDNEHSVTYAEKNNDDHFFISLNDWLLLSNKTRESNRARLSQHSVVSLLAFSLYLVILIQ